MHNLYENYELFIKEHAGDITSPSDALKLIADVSMFRSYVDALTENVEDSAVRSMLIKMLDRQRSAMLTESANVPASAFGFGFAVMSLPILVDIYAEPLIAKICNPYPVETPIASLPHVRIHSKTRNYDGTITEHVLPTPFNFVNADFVTVDCPSDRNTNIKSEIFGGDAEKFKMNRRYLMTKRLTLTRTSSASATDVINVDVNFVPDARSQIYKKFRFQGTDGAWVRCTFQGHVTWDTGNVFWNVVVDDSDSTDDAPTFTSARFIAKFVPVESMIGRTEVFIKKEMNDYVIDPQDDFLITLTQEDIQDYRSIFKIDLARTLSEAIKRQVLLNKDKDLSFFLEAAEYDMQEAGTAVNFDFRQYSQTVGTTNYRPNSALDVFKNIIPKIAYVSNKIRYNFNMTPKYLVTGLNTATMLKSMQDMLVTMPGLQGELGFTGATSSFSKLEILESAAIGNNKMYFSTKAEQNSLEKMTIIDLIFNPLYIVSETTDGNQRNFVRSRTMIAVPRTDGLGMINVSNLEDILIN